MDLCTLLIVVVALFAYLNPRILKLSDAISIMVVSLGFSLLPTLGACSPPGRHWPGPGLRSTPKPP